MRWLPSREVDQTILPLRPLVRAWLVARSAASGFTGAPLGGPAKTAAAKQSARAEGRAIIRGAKAKGMLVSSWELPNLQMPMGVNILPLPIIQPPPLFNSATRDGPFALYWMFP